MASNRIHWRFADLIDKGILQIGDGYRAKNSELGGSGPIFLRAGQVTDEGISVHGTERFHASLAEKVGSKIAQAGDTVVTTKGNSTGRTSYVTDTMPCFVYSPHLSFWRSANRDILDPRFLRYWAIGAEFREQLHGMKASTDMAPYLSLTDQRRLWITVPSLPEQRAIGQILGAFDDKIELNRRMNETLGALAQSLFQAWFVSPTRDGLPKGWREGTLGEVAENPRRGIQPDEIEPSTPYIALEHMPRRCIALSGWGYADNLESNKFQFKRGEILFGKLRPYFHKVGIAPTDGVCSTDILVIRPQEPAWFGFVLGHVSSVELVNHTDAASSGTKMPRTNWQDISRFGVALPPPSLVAQFTEEIRPLVDRIIANIHESRTLGSLRDALLPKLLSGEIRVRSRRGE